MNADDQKSYDELRAENEKLKRHVRNLLATRSAYRDATIGVDKDITDVAVRLSELCDDLEENYGPYGSRNLRDFSRDLHVAMINMSKRICGEKVDE